jgi:hypothetical protein
MGFKLDGRDRVSEWNERTEIGRDARDGAVVWGARGL